MPLVPKQVVQDRYEVVRSIKSGGMGAVYEAIDLKLASTPCAIKEILCSALQSADAKYVLQTFESEMRSLANLDHPNIPRVRDYFDIEGRRYIVLDLVQGQGLDDELQDHLRVTNEPMDPEVVALDMVSVLETLAYLHNHKPPIVHRDIKSANLIRDKRLGKIKLVDFGIARSVETQQVQTQVGTPGFCAPEQLAGRAEPRSDVFSVGATLYHLTTGKLPPTFAFEPMDAELSQHRGLTAIIKKATQLKPSERYASADEMAQALRRWLRNEASLKVVEKKMSPTVRQAMHPLATPPPAPNSNPTLILAATAMSLVASALLFVGTPANQRSASPTPTASQSPPPALSVTSSPISKIPSSRVEPENPPRRITAVTKPRPKPLRSRLVASTRVPKLAPSTGIQRAYPRAQPKQKPPAKPTSPEPPDTGDPVASPTGPVPLSTPDPGPPTGGFSLVQATERGGVYRKPVAGGAITIRVFDFEGASDRQIVAATLAYHHTPPGQFKMAAIGGLCNLRLTPTGGVHAVYIRQEAYFDVEMPPANQVAASAAANAVRDFMLGYRPK
ncbi:protein kinase [bacterium]|nr:protein kinase [bacterium]